MSAPITTFEAAAVLWRGTGGTARWRPANVDALRSRTRGVGGEYVTRRACPERVANVSSLRSNGSVMTVAGSIDGTEARRSGRHLRTGQRTAGARAGAALVRFGERLGDRASLRGGGVLCAQLVCLRVEHRDRLAIPVLAGARRARQSRPTVVLGALEPCDPTVHPRERPRGRALEHRAAAGGWRGCGGP